VTYRSDIERARNEGDLFLKEHYASPLPDEDQEVFVGLDYFPVDASWLVPVTLKEEDPSRIDIPSTSGMDSSYTTVGSASVAIGDRVYELVMLDDGDGGVFVPFRDGTCGTETYAGGRYVAVTTDEAGRSFLDFNKAHNPWCVYDDEFVCPLPPSSNWIDEPIPAGERMYRVGTGS